MTNYSFETLEKLNLDYLKIKDSKEFSMGTKFLISFNLIRKFKIITLIKRMYRNQKVKKLNTHFPKDNNYSYVKKENIENKKVIIYTCITGNYDQLKDPLYVNPNVDYVAFTDNNEIKSDVWTIKSIPDSISNLDNIMINRYIKMHPHILFENYDYAIYVDGSVQIMSDLYDFIYSVRDASSGVSMHRHQLRDCIYKEVKVCKILKKGNFKKMNQQIKKYEKEGFPKNFGMLEAGIIVTDINNQNMSIIMENWWNEFKSSESMRDQISLIYIIWKNNMTLQDFGNLGENLYMNPKFRIINH